MEGNYGIAIFSVLFLVAAPSIINILKESFSNDQK